MKIYWRLRLPAVAITERSTVRLLENRLTSIFCTWISIWMFYTEFQRILMTSLHSGLYCRIPFWPEHLFPLLIVAIRFFAPPTAESAQWPNLHASNQITISFHARRSALAIQLRLVALANAENLLVGPHKYLWMLKTKTTNKNQNTTECRKSFFYLAPSGPDRRPVSSRLTILIVEYISRPIYSHKCYWFRFVVFGGRK